MKKKLLLIGLSLGLSLCLIMAIRPMDKALNDFASSLQTLQNTLKPKPPPVPPREKKKQPPLPPKDKPKPPPPPEKDKPKPPRMAPMAPMGMTLLSYPGGEKGPLWAKLVEVQAIKKLEDESLADALQEIKMVDLEKIPVRIGGKDKPVDDKKFAGYRYIETATLPKITTGQKSAKKPTKLILTLALLDRFKPAGEKPSEKPPEGKSHPRKKPWEEKPVDESLKKRLKEKFKKQPEEEPEEEEE